MSSTSEILQRALQASQFSQAESLYHEILHRESHHSDALHCSGLLAFHRQQYEEAGQLIQQAIQLNPQVPNFHNSLGNVLRNLGQLEAAMISFQQALQLNPNFAEAYNNLGSVLGDQQQFSEAVTYFQQAIALNPHYVKAHYNLGRMFSAQGQLTQALAAYQQSVVLQPDYVEAYYEMGNVFYAQAQWSEAVKCYQQALVLNPSEARFHKALGKVFYEQYSLPQALAHYQQAWSLNPQDAETSNNLGAALFRDRQWETAIYYYQQALILAPDQPYTHFNLGLTFYRLGQLTKAMEYFQQALTLAPGLASKVYLNLAHVLSDRGQSEEALDYYRRALQIEPWNDTIQMSLVFTLNHASNYDAKTIFAEHQKFNERYALPLAALIKPHRNLPNKQKKLKVAYVSPDFRGHVVGLFMEPILAHHDHEHFEIFCYYNNTYDDKITGRLRSYVDHWVNCVHLSDAEIVEQIRADQIDILVDLAGQTADHQLLVFARKPAPVQVTYLGYPYTTGLTAIDYRITDGYLDQAGLNEHFNTETPFKMPACLFCYQPYSHSPPVNALPALTQGYVTFSSFNRYDKINLPLLELWAQVLTAVPNSKLVIQMCSFKDPATKQAFQTQVEQLGIDEERLILKECRLAPKHLETYHQVDIALDSYPFNGGMTTCEALWMGIPVVSWMGERQVSRMGLSILSTIGLNQLVAPTPHEYLNICIRLANNIESLQRLRTTLRERMLSSPLMDAATFTRHLEAGYRNMWQKWCEKRP